MRLSIFLFLIFLVGFGCTKDDEPMPVPFVNTIQLNQPTDGCITPMNHSISWNQIEDERTVVELFSDDSYTEDARIFWQTPQEADARSINLTTDLEPGRDYWLQLSNETANTNLKITFKAGIEPYVGDHSVKITEALPDGNEPSFSGTLSINKVDEGTIRLVEPQSGLDLELTYENTIALKSFWFTRTNPDANIGLFFSNGNIEVKYYLVGLNLRPFWDYETE